MAKGKTEVTAPAERAKDADKRSQRVQDARTAYDSACRVYNKLIGANTAKMGAEQLDKHTAECKKALAEKRLARETIERRKRNRPDPERGDLAESRSANANNN